MSKHTPGPWKYHSGPSMVFANNDQSHVADIRGWGELSTTLSAEEAVAVGDANGALIAAAPDLLEAAKRVIESADGYGSYIDAFEALRAAIEKAEGRQ